MIVIRLFGGLGNQMFQYAFGLSLASKYKVILVLDRSEFSQSRDKNTPRPYELNHFHIEEKFLDEVYSHPFKLAESEETYRFFRKCLSYLPNGFLQYFKENQYAFNESFIECSGIGYFDGYWQSPKYFSKSGSIIRKAFQPKIINTQSQSLIKQIEKTKNSVSLHVRRGDYVTNKHANKHHGVCSLNYYYEAIKLLEKESPELEFFLFSDDPEWVRENLKIEHKLTIVDFNGPEFAYLDMYMMSKCQYHIMANSSFSWWGAWLAGEQAKKVIAPKKWFQSSVSASDLMVEGWVVL